MADIKKTLDKIQEQLKSLEGKADKAKGAKSSGTPWGWIISLAIGAVISIGAGLLIWKLNKKNKELAKLRTKVEQDAVHAEQLKHEAAVVPHKETARLLAAKANALADQAAKELAALKVEEERHANAMTRVVAAKNWDQLDALNKEGR